MFDGTLKATPDENAELARLGQLYDGLLDQPPVGIPAEAQADLAAMARIFDLDTDRPPTEVWRDLRAVLTRQAVPGAGAGDPPPAPGALTLMVVEDDPALAADLTELLTAAGHGVVGPFSDAATATTAAGLHAIDLALLDINLADDPGDGSEGGGVALARTLKDTWGVPALFLSGDVAAAARHARLASALVMKPYTGREVLNGIARAVAAGAVAP
ncbi:MAG: response regulator [Alphaproteobacteria bacterium]|jgi:two-component system, response regulator PdtaR|nr:response regulator [Alphaproteobacteria bacterium]MBU2041475.1 response regulator [Alphaproteobacteria bacterium]MBU2125059.1 response regulator [Alphaproteobacteria bacterium]MBU2208281.1 response regulator [Alphaproteobacteria bacterium]MBU2289739.1 response regulator [Alphaproteobacteria bacterium]